MNVPEPERVLVAAKLVRTGRMYRLAVPRFPGMPLGAGHPPFQVLTYRSPHGLSLPGQGMYRDGNDAGVAYSNDLLIGGSHTGTHVDALGHVAIGDDQRWHDGSTMDDLGDFGLLRGGADELAAIWCRGVLFDVAAYRGVRCLAAGEAITADDLIAISEQNAIELQAGDVALIRTGHMGDWPDPERLSEHHGAGASLSAARWLADKGVAAVGSDTEAFEVRPPIDYVQPSNPLPVHTLLLVERGICIMESLSLEGLSRDAITEFLFVALPLAIRGATASMIDPVAVI